LKALLKNIPTFVLQRVGLDITTTVVTYMICHELRSDDSMMNVHEDTIEAVPVAVDAYVAANIKKQPEIDLDKVPFTPADHEKSLNTKSSGDKRASLMRRFTIKRQSIA
jgi:hypothetical protein